MCFHCCRKEGQEATSVQCWQCLHGRLPNSTCAWQPSNLTRPTAKQTTQQKQLMHAHQHAHHAQQKYSRSRRQCMLLHNTKYSKYRVDTRAVCSLTKHVHLQHCVVVLEFDSMQQPGSLPKGRCGQRPYVMPHITPTKRNRLPASGAGQCCRVNPHPECQERKDAPSGVGV